LSSASLAGLLNIESEASAVLVGAFHSSAFFFLVLRLVGVFSKHVIVVNVKD
jgi:hypothetical protein